MPRSFYLKKKKVFNPRQAGGFLTPPSGFHRYLKKQTAALRAAILGYVLIHLFHTLCENFRPRSLKVRLPGYVKWLHLRKTLNARHRFIATLNDRSPRNFQRLIAATVSIKRSSRNIEIGDLRSGQFCDVSIISQWEKHERHLFWTKAIRNILKHRVTGRLHLTMNWNVATSDPLLMLPRSYQVM